MSFYLVLAAFIVYHLLRFLRIFETSDPPSVHHQGSVLTSKILKRCPSLTKVYNPPAIWGKCGHVQTTIYGKIGRLNAPILTGRRFFKLLPSSETISYDVFEAVNEHKTKRDYTILVCPGIANSSEKAYVRTFIDYAVKEGFRVIVLNHIGSLANVKLTSPKIFTYGDTKYYSSMIDAAKKLYKDSTFVILGYSMGGNIAMKYLGEKAQNQHDILCAISLCQGYDAIRSTEPMKYGFRKIYNRMITMNLKKIIRPHWDELFGTANRASNSNFVRIESAKCLHDIEDGLLRHFDGHESVRDYMDKASCSHVLHNVKIPVLLVNSSDDPVVVNDIHDVPMSHIDSNENAIFAVFKHGGHLGYYTGAWYRPDDVTLVEKMIVEYFNSVIDIHFDQSASK